MFDASFQGPEILGEMEDSVLESDFGRFFSLAGTRMHPGRTGSFYALFGCFFRTSSLDSKCCLPDKARSSALRCRMRPTQSGAISIETIHTTCMEQYSRICMENENCVSAGNSQLYVAKGTNALTINIRASVSRCRRVYPRCFQAIRMKSTLTPSNVQTIGHGLITAVSGCEFMMNQAEITGTSPFISSVKTLKAIVESICS